MMGLAPTETPPVEAGGNTTKPEVVVPREIKKLEEAVVNRIAAGEVRGLLLLMAVLERVYQPAPICVIWRGVCRFCE